MTDVNPVLKNLFKIKMDADNIQDSFIEMNGVRLEGVVRFNTGMIAGSRESIVVLEMDGAYYMDLIANQTIVQANESSDHYLQRAGDILFELLVDDITDEKSVGETQFKLSELGISPLKLKELTRQTLSHIVNEMAANKDLP